MDLEERLAEFITSTFVNRCSVFDIQKELQGGLIPLEWLRLMGVIVATQRLFTETSHVSN